MRQEPACFFFAVCEIVTAWKKLFAAVWAEARQSGLIHYFWNFSCASLD
jgi:hypothetical protein